MTSWHSRVGSDWLTVLLVETISVMLKLGIGHHLLSETLQICSVFTLRYFKSFQINYVFFPTLFLCPASSHFIFLTSRSGNLATSWILFEISEHISASAPAQNKIYGYWLVTESDRKSRTLMKQLKICCKCCWESTYSVKHFLLHLLQPFITFLLLHEISCNNFK